MKKLILPITLVMALTCSCKTKKSEQPTPEPAPVEANAVVIGGGKNLARIPKATAFRTTPQYANHVAVNIHPDGSLSYWPAPTDLSEQSKPVDLGNGWWLNRQGFSSDAVFLTYTIDEYRKLKNITADEVRKAIIPESQITEFIRLPYNINEASSHIEAIKKYLNPQE